MIKIRRATEVDAAVLASLRWEFRAGRRTPTEDRDRFLTRCTAWMRDRLAAGDCWRAWAAENDGELVGQVWLRTVEKLPNPAGDREQIAYLSNLYVTPAARGGAGAELLKHAIEWAAGAGVERIVLWPSNRSRPLYMRFGFSDRVECLELLLPGADE